MPQEVIETLNMIGLTEYEAKAYVSLVEYGMATAREITEHSGVPQGRIYSVLKSLLDKNFIEVQEGSPAYYYADNPSEVLIHHKNEMNRAIDKLTEHLSTLHLNSKAPNFVWTIRSELGIKNRLSILIQNANHEIIICISDPAIFRWIKPELAKLRHKISVKVYANNKSDFVGTNLRITEFSGKIKGLRDQMKMMTTPNDQEMEPKVFIIIDGEKLFMINSIHGQYTGNVVNMPHLAFMVKEFLEISE